MTPQLRSGRFFSPVYPVHSIMPRAAPKTSPFILTVSCALLVVCAGLPLAVGPLSPVEAFVACSTVASLLYLVFVPILARTTLSRRWMIILIAGSALVRVSLLPLDPIGSDDIYRYVWDGTVQWHGIDPYNFAPNDPALSSLASETLPARVNNPSLHTVYLPFTQWIFFISYAVAGESLLGMKLLALALELLTIIAVVLLLRALKRDPRWVLLYALCPLPIFHFALDAHVDIVGICLLAFGYLLWLKDRPVLSMVLVALALSIKPLVLILLPVFWLNAKSSESRRATVVVPLLIVLGQFFPYLLNGGVFTGLSTFARDWTYNAAIFSVVELLVNNNQIARVICGLLLAASLLFIYVRKQPFHERLNQSLMMLLLLSPVVHPWYVGWMAVFIPLFPRWSSVFLVSLISLTGTTLIAYASEAVWRDYPLVRALEYVPVLSLFVLEETRGAFGRALRGWFDDRREPVEPR